MPSPIRPRSAKSPYKRILAYAVTEPDEHTGGIVFASSKIAARRIGAALYCDGDFSYARCRRAKFADDFAKMKQVPASAMVDAGWHFECHGCGIIIDSDLPDRWRNEAGDQHTIPDLLAAARRYRGWTPDEIVGYQHTAIYCDETCQHQHITHEAERKRREARAIAALKRLVSQRFPDASFPDNKPASTFPSPRSGLHHAYAEQKRGRWRLRQIRVDFAFPGMTHGYASLNYNPQSRQSREERKPKILCCTGDKEAFEIWAKQQHKGNHAHV